MSEPEPTVGVGPHPDPWPDDPRLDPVLLADGDRRNVLDVYRYWSVEAIVADLDTRRHPFHVAIENWEHDRNIGTVVRTANAFLAAEVHIVGKRKWNRRGAMMTDVYQHVRHHESIESLLDWTAAHDDGPLPVIGSAGQMQQVAMNLVQNAADATRLTDLPTLRIAAEQVSTAQGPRILLRFVDNGPGIAPAHLAHVFDPFFTTKPVGQGTGLGLSISYGIVERHGGSLRAENLPAGGAAFTLELPLAR